MSEHRPSIFSFYAMAFTENFSIPETAAALAGEPSLMDPRESVTRAIGVGRFFAYNFGALCFVNVGLEAREAERERLVQAKLLKGGDLVTTEDFIVEERPGEKPRVEFSKLVIDALTPQRMEVVALTVAQSAAMSFYENYYLGVHKRVGAMVERLSLRGSPGIRAGTLARVIADVITMRSEVVDVLYLLDRPDLIWDDRVMDALYDDLRTVFDLKERFETLAHKLDHIQQTVELLVDVARDRRGFFLELSIVVLIMAEIGLSLLKFRH